MDAGTHGTDDQIERYTIGTLPDAELAILEDHLLICEECRGRTEDTQAFTMALRDALKEAPVSAQTVSKQKATFDLTGWLRRPAVSMAFGFVLLFCVLAIFSNQRNGLPAVAVLQLTATRGEVPTVGRARELDLRLAGAPQDGGPYRVEVVDAQGKNIWGSLADNEGDAVLVKVPMRMQSGEYFVRLYSADGPIVHEYGFRLRD